METLRRDLQFALRAWRHRALLASVVVLTLGLGFSATSVIFSVVNAVLLTPLPFPNPEGLVVVRAGLPGQEQAIAQLAGPELLALRERSTALRHVGGIWARPGVLGRAHSAVEIEVGWITPGLLEAFGVQPQLGRLPTSDEHQRTDVVVLSDGLWRSRFGGDLSIIGRRIDFDDEPRTVVAVMPSGFRMLFPPVDGVPESIQAWLPWGAELRTMSRGFRVFTAVGRLQDEAGVSALDGELRSLARAIAAESGGYARSGFALRGEVLLSVLTAQIRPTLLVLLSVVGLVWIIACANVANLLLIRAFERTTEFSVRLALGARRSRLWRQLLTECALIGIGGAAVGLLFAYYAIATLRRLSPEGIPRLHDATLDLPTLGLSAAAAIVAALFFGSIATSHAASLTSQQHQARRGSSARTRPAQRLLVITQVGLSIVLLTGAGLLVRSLGALREVDLGYSPDRIVSMRISLPDTRYPYETDGVSIAEFYRQLLESVRQVPGVLAAGATVSPPLAEAPLRARPYTYRVADGEIEWGAIAATYRTVTPGWFQTVGARLVAGRFLDDRDRWDRPVAVVVDTTLATRAWPGREAVGQAIKVELFRNGVFGAHWGEVVGVVEPLRLTGLTRPEREQVYLAHHQTPQRTMFPAVLARGELGTIVAGVQRALWEQAPDLPVFDVQPYSAYVDNAMAQTRFATIALAVFACFAVFLAASGLFASLSASVTQRSREIGVRLALGAPPRQVFRSIVAHGLELSAIGMAIGLAATVVLTRFLSSLLFSVDPIDGVTLISVTAVVAATSLGASSVPALRAVHIDPCESLKSS